MSGFKIITQNCANGAQGWDKRLLLDTVIGEGYAMVCLQDTGIHEGDVEQFERQVHWANMEQPGTRLRYKIFWEQREQDEVRRGLNATLVVGSVADGTTQIRHDGGVRRVVSTRTHVGAGQYVTVHNLYGHPQVRTEEREEAVQTAELLFSQVTAYDMEHADDTSVVVGDLNWTPEPYHHVRVILGEWTAGEESAMERSRQAWRDGEFEEDTLMYRFGTGTGWHGQAGVGAALLRHGYQRVPVHEHGLVQEARQRRSLEGRAATEEVEDMLRMFTFQGNVTAQSGARGRLTLQAQASSIDHCWVRSREGVWEGVRDPAATTTPLGVNAGSTAERGGWSDHKGVVFSLPGQAPLVARSSSQYPYPKRIKAEERGDAEQARYELEMSALITAEMDGELDPDVLTMHMVNVLQQMHADGPEKRRQGVPMGWRLPPPLAIARAVARTAKKVRYRAGVRDWRQLRVEWRRLRRQTMRAVRMQVLDEAVDEEVDNNLADTISTTAAAMQRCHQRTRRRVWRERQQKGRQRMAEMAAEGRSPKEFWDLLTTGRKGGLVMPVIAADTDGQMTADEAQVKDIVFKQGQGFYARGQTGPEHWSLEDQQWWRDITVPMSGAQESWYDAVMAPVESVEELDKFNNALNDAAPYYRDGITKKLVANAGWRFKDMLRRAINGALSAGRSPREWLRAAQLHLEKTDYAGDGLKRCRPIGISCYFQMLLEKIVNTRVSEILFRERVFSPIQSGFRRDAGALDVQAVLTASIERGWQDGTPVHILSTDISNAFNSPQHWLIAAAMTRVKFPARLQRMILQWHQDTAIEIKTGFKNGFTVPFTPEAGMIQGRIISPLLWNLVYDILLQRLLDMSAEHGLHAGNPGHVIADDLTLVSRTPEGLERMYAEMHRFCNSTHIKLCTSKTAYTTSVTTPRALQMPDQVVHVHETGVAKVVGVLHDASNNPAKSAKSSMEATKMIRARMPVMVKRGDWVTPHQAASWVTATGAQAMLYMTHMSCLMANLLMIRCGRRRDQWLDGYHRQPLWPR